jgi:hypothetical protein
MRYLYGCLGADMLLDLLPVASEPGKTNNS